MLAYVVSVGNEMVAVLTLFSASAVSSSRASVSCYCLFTVSFLAQVASKVFITSVRLSSALIAYKCIYAAIIWYSVEFASP